LAKSAVPLPAAPTRGGGPAKSWKHRVLYDRVLDALHALPARFRTSLRIAGISATDLFTLNTPLGAAIEQSVVESLNGLRELWDPSGQYEVYSFVRQAQVFPDVRLQTTAPGIRDPDRIIMGIELKGWFILSKEGEPSFRYRATPAACAPADLLVVYPWSLAEVLSGAPRLMRPFVDEARYAAEMRNYYWQHKRQAQNSAVVPAPHQLPYPNKNQKFNDDAGSDAGGNFGRVARSDIMEDFIKALMNEPLAGIPALYWQSFLKIFAEGITGGEIERKIARLRADADKAGLTKTAPNAFDKIEDALRELFAKL
jgi:hypothetical protein